MFRQSAPTHPEPLLPPFPTSSSYTLLPEYEAQTPQRFHYPAKDVLHAYLGRCSVSVQRRDITASDTWRDFFCAENGDTAPTEDEWRTKKDATGFVTSASLVLLPHPQNEVVDPQAQPITPANAVQEVGLRVPYPSIQLHAIRNLDLEDPANTAGEGRAALYLQIEMGPRSNGEEEEDEDMDGGVVVEVLIIPEIEEGAPAAGVDNDCFEGEEDEVISSHINGDAVHGTNGTETQPQAQAQTNPRNMQRVQHFYAALSACQDLHPDPHDSDSDDDRGQSQGGGGLAGMLAGMSGGSSMPGEGGWITSENAHLLEGEFPDIPVIGGEDADGDGEAAQGQGEGGVILGPGAGRRREREADGIDEDGTDAGVEETKWQRTA